MNKAVLMLMPTLMLLYLVGCPMYTAVAFKYAKAAENPGDGASPGGDPSAVISTAESITLAWDPPPTAVARYKVFFRIHDTSTWYSIQDSVDAVPAPEYTVQHTSIDPGIYDFGVKAINAESLESTMHMSVETTAQPETGWYLVWE